jgi:hypothetical protein
VARGHIGPRIPLSKATAYAAKVVRFGGPNPGLRWEDIEDIAASAWFSYWRSWRRTGRDHPAHLRADILDAVRIHRASRSKLKRVARSQPAVSDLGLDDSRPMPDRAARHAGFAAVDAADLLEEVERRTSPLFAGMVRLRLSGHTAEEIGGELGCSSTGFGAMRRYYFRRIRDLA